MTTEIKSIICDRSHLEDINKIIEPHTTMYGVNIVYSGLKEIHKNTIRHILNNPFSLSKVVATVTDKIDCFAVYVPWQGLPFYTASFMYYSFARNDIGNFFHHGIKLMEKMTEIGEENNRFEYYYMIRDRQYDRVEKTWSLNESMHKRYEVINMEYLKPGQISKYSTFNSLFSGIIGQQKKPVMIRKAQLRKEYRLPLS
jgi:hypothetical protein